MSFQLAIHCSETEVQLNVASRLATVSDVFNATRIQSLGQTRSGTLKLSPHNQLSLTCLCFFCRAAMNFTWHLQLHSQNNSLTSLLPLPSKLFFCPALAFHLCSLKMWMYSNVDLWNHPAMISIFWMCSHLGFFLYILSFQVLCVWVSISSSFSLCFSGRGNQA